MKAKTVLRSVMVLIGVALASGAGGVIIGRQMNAPATVESSKPSHSSAQVRTPPTLARPAQTQPAKTEIPPRYEFIVQRNLFQSPPASAHPESETPEPDEESQPAPPTVTEAVPTASDAPQSVSDIAVTGVVTTENKRLAVIECLTTRERDYVEEGQTAFGYQVDDISPEGVTVRRGDNHFLVQLGDSKISPSGTLLVSAKGVRAKERRAVDSASAMNLKAWAAAPNFVWAAKAMEQGKKEKRKNQNVATPADYIDRELTTWQKKMAKSGASFNAVKELRKTQERYLRDWGQEMPAKAVRQFKALTGQ